MDRLKKQIPKTLASIGVGIFLLGVLFKVQYWSHSTFLILFGGFGFLAFNLVHFLQQKRKKLEQYLQFFVGEFWMVYLLFRINTWPLKKVFLALAGIATCAWATYLIFDYFIKEGKRKKTRLEIVAQLWWMVAALLIIVGVVHRIQHWPYSEPMLYTGFALGIIWAFINFFVPIRKEDDEELNIDENY